jgi:hypothetical protein
MEASLAVRENTPHRRDQPIEFDRRGVELVTPSGNRLFALARQRVRGQNDDRDVAGLRIALQSPCGRIAENAPRRPGMNCYIEDSAYASIQNISGLPQGLAGSPCGRLEVRKTERTGQSAALIAHRGGSPPCST